MTKRGKYFVPPPKNGGDFKEVFLHLASSGAGRPVDRDGFPKGPWTPYQLVEAILELDDSGIGVDLRTVQLWFQDNDKGISSTNIRWLARVFGCDDPVATSGWQTELSAAQARLVAKRRQLRKGGEAETAEPEEDSASQVKGKKRWFDIAAFSEQLFSGAPLNIAAPVFAGAVALGLTSYFLKIHSADYTRSDGLVKQIGFLWTPNWTILFLVLLPLFFAFASELLNYWKSEGRPGIFEGDDRLLGKAQFEFFWRRSVEALSVTYWAAMAICLPFAGVFQWVSERLIPLLGAGSSDTLGQHAPDWGFLTIVRPDLISVPEAIAFSGLAYLYMCVCFYLFFAGLILLYTVSHDLWVIRVSSSPGLENETLRLAGGRVVRETFRCAILGVLVATCMKLESAYLASNAEDIVSWLGGDLEAALKASDHVRSLGKFRAYSAPNNFSSLIVVLASVFVLGYSAFRSGVGRRFLGSVGVMAVIMVVLLASYSLIGEFTGFSVVLVFGWVLALYGLINPGFRQIEAVEPGAGRRVL